MKSKITGGETKLIFKLNVLNKYDVAYYECVNTGYIQTEEPYWLDEAYSTAITKMDVGLVNRNVVFANRLPQILYKNFNDSEAFLDYAGGYGLFTRLMRDKGFNFYTTDKYCTNLFAEHYDLSKQNSGKFGLLTAFEVLEHLPDPMAQLPELFGYSDSLLFSTEIFEGRKEDLKSWWYFIPETGQHISFYTLRSLEYIAAKFNKNFYTDGRSLHLMTDRELEPDVLKKREPFFIRKMRKLLKKHDARNSGNKKSLAEADWCEAEEKMFGN